LTAVPKFRAFQKRVNRAFLAHWRIVQARSIVHQAVAETDLASENAQPKYSLGRAQ
jgi:hypothetical protein